MSIVPVVGYIRVSTDEQVEGFSLDAQEERIRAYAKSQDYTLIEIYRDNGYSAKDLNRPGIKRLLDDLKKRRFRIVLVYRLDRLTRRLKDLNDLVESFERYRVKFQSVTEPFETKTAAGRLMMNVFGGFAQFERELNSERVYTGLKKRFETGNWMAAAPYGYRMQKGKLVINPDETKMVKKIYQMYLETGYGLTDLARRLNDEGYRSRNGKRWRPSVLYRILTYKVYIGYTVWSGKYRKGIHQPIIDRYTHDLVQENLKEKRNYPARRLSSPHILTGLITCNRCGAKMFVHRPGGKKKKYRYYLCGNRSLDHSCNQQYINAEKLERSIFTKIEEVSKDPELIESFVERFKGNKLTERSSISQEADKLRRKIKEIISDQDQLANWSVDTLPSRVAMERLNRKLELLEEKKEELQRGLIRLEAKEEGLNLKEITPEKISSHLSCFDFYWSNLNKHQQKLLSEILIKGVKISSKSEIFLQLRLPLNPLFPTNLTSSGSEILWRCLSNYVRTFAQQNYTNLRG